MQTSINFSDGQSPSLPFGFINSSITLTDQHRVKFDGLLQKRDLSSLNPEQLRTLLEWEESEGFGVGACLNVFPNGEVSGGCYSRGYKALPTRTNKPVVSQSFTNRARKQIRRAVDCYISGFKVFITLTFDPAKSVLDETGSVCQAWAKKQLTRFVNTITVSYNRLAEKTNDLSKRLQYIWVAEIQEKTTKNIHFHILVNRSFIPVAWLSAVWGQSSNSVDVQRLNDKHHASSYMLKYMEKGNCPISGKRYGMSQELIENSKPVRYDFYGRFLRARFLRIKDDLTRSISLAGGYVADWGFSIPSPRRARRYRNKKGEMCATKAVNSRVVITDAMNRFADLLCDDYESPQLLYSPSTMQFETIPF